MRQYRVKLTKDDGAILVSVPAVPIAHTFGEDRLDALRHASDAIETAFIGYMKDGQPIPAGDYAGRGDYVTLPALAEAKIGLYEAMRVTKVGKAELGRRLGRHLHRVDRLLDLRHASRLDQLEEALRALGKTLEIRIGTAA
jgi:antitoxin HicB